MTLQEIFKSVRFEDMVKYLIDIESQVFENLYCFKEAFDVLRMMEAKEGKNIPIEIERVIDDFDEKPFLSVSFKVREEWDCILSRIVEVNENTDATIEEIAATILWEITFYGFSPEEESEGFTLVEQHKYMNPYEEQYFKIKQKLHDTNCRNRTDIGKNTYSLSDLFWKPRRNGPKRHRENRLMLRAHLLEKKMRRWDLFFRLKVQNNLDDGIAKRLHDEIMNGNTFHHCFMESRTQSGDDIDYLVALIQDYFPVKQGNKSIVLTSAPEILSNGDELNYAIREAFGAFRKIPSPKYIFSTNNDRKNIRIDLLVFE